MIAKLKKKYTSRHEPEDKKGRAKFSNSRQWGRGGSDTHKLKKSKGLNHPVTPQGGRTVGLLQRHFTDRKKKA